MNNPNKALWEKGDFTRIAGSMRESGTALVASLGIRAGMKVTATNGQSVIGTARRGLSQRRSGAGRSGAMGSRGTLIVGRARVLLGRCYWSRLRAASFRARFVEM